MKKQYLFLLLIVLISCQSVLDDDIDRKKNIVGRHKIPAFVTQIIFEENGVSKTINIGNSDIKIDTTYNPPVIWMKLGMKLPEYSNFDFARLQLDSLYLFIDSLVMTPSPSTLGSYSRYSLFKVLFLSIDGELTANSVNSFSLDAFSDISFNTNGSMNEAWASYYGKVYNSQVIRDTSFNIIDTVINGEQIKWPIEIIEEKTIRDSLIIRSNFKLTY